MSGVAQEPAGDDAAESAAPEEACGIWDLSFSLLKGIGLTCAGAVLFLIAVFFYSMYSASTGVGQTPRDKVKQECAPIIAWLEDYKKGHGHFPQALLEEHKAILKSFNPQGEYVVDPDGKGYCVGCGRDSEGMYKYYWCSEIGTWRVDA